MSPPISVVHGISNRQRKKIAKWVAVEFDLDYGETQKMAKSVSGIDFVKSFSVKIKISPKNITSVLKQHQAVIRV